MHDSSVKVNPLSKKIVENVFHTVLANYSRVDQEKQFEICDLALKLENLLLVDSKGSTVEHSKDDIVVDKPSQELLAKQPKNRLMTATEKVQRQVKRSNRLNPSK